MPFKSAAILIIFNVFENIELAIFVPSLIAYPGHSCMATNCFLLISIINCN